MNIAELLFGENKTCLSFKGENNQISFSFADGSSETITLPPDIIFIGQGIWDIGFVIRCGHSFEEEEFCPILFANQKWGMIDKYFKVVTSKLYDELGIIERGNKCYLPPYSITFDWEEEYFHSGLIGGKSEEIDIEELRITSKLLMDNYIERIKNLEEISINTIIEDCKNNLPKSYCKTPWYYPELEHGTAVLETQAAMDCYIVSYGEMHQKKCRASLQHINFETLGNFEIWDWGCGQGLASLALIEMLKERDKLNFLRKITLVEASPNTLKRAELILKKACPNIETITINKYLPSLDEKELDIRNVNFQYTNVIHLFSNILDIEAIDLKKTAKLITQPGKKNFIMCFGPMNNGSYRLNQFASYFEDSEELFKIHTHAFGYTSTKKKFGCNSICFIHSNERLNLNKEEPFSLLHGNNSVLKNDYDIKGLLIQNKLPIEFESFYRRLENSRDLNEFDSLFINPMIGNNNIDLVLLRPFKGVLLLNIIKGKPSIHEIQPEVLKIQSMKENIMRYDLDSVWGKIINNNRSVWSIIKSALYFTDLSCNDIYEWLYENRNEPELKNEKLEIVGHNLICGYKYTRFIGNDSLTKSPNAMQLGWFAPIYSNQYFDEITYKSIIRILSPEWHSYKEGTGIELDKTQEKLAKYPNVTKLINGVAGSGKTQIMVQRAVNTHIATGDEVLILSYNIALANYIKYRLNQVKADFSRSAFEILSYHRFFKKKALRLDLKPKRREKENNGFNHYEDEYAYSYDDVDFFSTNASQTKRFKHIFIDEIQDFTQEWIEIIQQFFLDSGGEIVGFGDASQNIYHRPVNDKGQIKLNIARNGWNNSLTKSHRFRNGILTNLIASFHNEFIKEPLMPVDGTINYEEFSGKYIFMDSDRSSSDICESFMKIIDSEELKLEELVVISNYKSVLQALEEELRVKHGIIANTTFPTNEEIKKIYKSNNQFPDRDIDNLERSKKIYFNMDNRQLKIATIHSFKGWESKNIILIIEQHETNDELLYTALTRAREKVYVINLGNNKYHDFFNKNIKDFSSILG